MAVQRLLGFVSLCCAIAVAIEAQAIQYSITDLGEYSATQLNNHGQVVGTLSEGSGNTEDLLFYIWENGVWTYLRLSPGSFADKLTDGGKVLFGQLQQPMVLDTKTGITSGFPIVNLNNIREIDDAGNAVGYTKWPDGHHGVIYRNGVLQDLGSKAGANGFNAAGQVVGYAEVESGEIQAALFDSGSVTDLGVLEGQSVSSATEVNDHGWIIGASYDPDWRAFVHRDGQMHDLGDLGGGRSSPLDINNHNQIVGVSQVVSRPGTEYSENSRAFLYQNDQMLNLNLLIDPALGWELRMAYAINDAGLILGTGQLNGERHSFLLTPVAEPSTCVLGAFALFGLLTVQAIRLRRGKKV